MPDADAIIFAFGSYRGGGMSKSAADVDNKQVVFALSRPSRCYGCDKKLLVDEIVKLKESGDETEVLCSPCSGLSTFALVPKGNAKVTRLAKKYSKVHYAVVKWSALWKCYERIGILAERAAIDQAQTEA
jgi:hypothetical protein